MLWGDPKYNPAPAFIFYPQKIMAPNPTKQPPGCGNNNG
jgi:hypothetical protein